MPGTYNRWGWPTLLAAIVAVLFAVWAGPTGRVPRWFVVAVAIGAVIFVVAGLLSPDPLSAFFGRAPRYEGAVVAPVILAAIWLGSRLLGPRVEPKALRATTVAASAASLALGGVAVLEGFGLRPIETDLVRPGSLAGNATDQGILGAMFLCVLAHMVLGVWQRDRRIDAWPTAGAVAALAAVITSASRAAFLALVIVAAVLAVRAVLISRRRVVAALAALGVLATTGVAAILLPDVRGRLLAIDSFASKTIGDRLTIWTDATQIVAAHPWLGIGPNGYLDAVTAAYDESWYRGVTPDHILDSPHNVVLQVALAGGVPAAVGALLLFTVILVVGVRATRTALSGRRDLLFGALTFLPAAAVALLASPTSPKTLLPLAVLVGVLIARDAVVLIGYVWRWVLTALVLTWAGAVVSWTIADAHLLAGVRAAVSGRFDDADASFTAAATLRPWDADIPLTATRALGGAVVRGLGGAIDLAAEWGDRTADRLPRSAAAQEAAGMTSLERGNLALAAERLGEASALAPVNPRIAHEFGIASLAAGDLAAAREALERAVRLAPDSAQSRAALADVSRRLGYE